MCIKYRKIFYISLLLVIFTLKQKCTENEESFTFRFNKIINGDSVGEYKIGAIKPLLFIIDNFEISHLFWNRKSRNNHYFGLSCGYCHFADVINISEKCTISFFNSHINFIRFILHTIRFFFHFYCDCLFANDRPSWDQALYKSAVHSLVLNTMCNIHLFTISYYNIKINLFSCINILTFCVYVIEEYVDKMVPSSNNNTHDSGDNNNTNNNANNNTGKNSSFFINFNHHKDCYTYDSRMETCLTPFNGSSRLYLFLYPRIEIFL